MDRAGIVKENTLENLSKTCPPSSDLDLADILRIRNSTVKRFTWSQNSEEKRHLTGRYALNFPTEKSFKPPVN